MTFQIWIDSNSCEVNEVTFDTKLANVHICKLVSTKTSCSIRQGLASTQLQIWMKLLCTFGINSKI
jgi:hypothetical protein